MKTKFFFTTCIFLSFSFLCNISQAQQVPTFIISADTNTNRNTIFYYSFLSGPDIYLQHSATIKDSVFFEKNKKLKEVGPNKYNYRNFYTLACTLWNMGMIEESEKMFLTILESKAAFYTANYYYGSDIPGDKTTNAYGYGSFTTNYKNDASQYLCKIYLEKKQFANALKYIQLADHTYKVVQNCGTGYHWYREEIDGMYGLCYEGLGNYDSILHMYLPKFNEFGNALLVRSIRKLYTPAEIKKQFIIAEESLVCEVDTFQSTSYIIHHFGEKNEQKTEVKYTAGHATMLLFGMEVTLPNLSLSNGETASRERFLNEFQSSGFYRALLNKE